MQAGGEQAGLGIALPAAASPSQGQRATPREVRGGLRLSQRVAPEANDSAVTKAVSQELCGIFVTPFAAQVCDFAFVLADCFKKSCAHVLPRWLVVAPGLPPDYQKIGQTRRKARGYLNFL